MKIWSKKKDNTPLLQYFVRKYGWECVYIEFMYVECPVVNTWLGGIV